MAIPPRARGILMENIPGAPEWVRPLVEQLNSVLGGLVDGVSNRLTRRENMLSAEKLGYVFTTKPNAPDTFPLRFKNTLPVKPRFLWANLERKDGIAITSTWSYTWTLNASNEIEVRFQGLDASQDFRVSLVWE